ncbi:MAG: HAD family phosphatase [Chitinophagales bacterium]
MQNIQTLIFDLGGVILNLKNETDWFKENLLSNFHPEKLHQLQQNNFFHQFEKGKVSEQDFIQQLKNISLNNEISQELIIQNWNSVLLEIPQYRVDLLKRLSGKYKLILLSNTNSIHLQQIRKYVQQTFNENILEGFFDTCYYSHEMGFRKPDKELYTFVMQEQQIEPGEVLFLDDKAENLIEPQKLGWQTMRVNFNKLSINDLEHLL